MDNMQRIEKIVAELPEAERVDVAEWGDHPTFRVRGKNFIFCDGTGQHHARLVEATETSNQ